MSDDRVEVLLVDSPVRRRAWGRRLAGLIQELSAQGIDARLFCLGGSQHVIDAGVGAIEDPRLRNRWLQPIEVGRFIRRSPQIRPQLIHALRNGVGELGQTFATRWDVPLIGTIEDFPTDNVSLKHDPRQCASIVVGAEVLRDYLIKHQGLAKGLIHVIPPGLPPVIPPDREESVLERLPLADRRIPVVGSLVEERDLVGAGLETVLSAIHEVSALDIDLELLIAGVGRSESEVRKVASRLSIADRLTIVSSTPLEPAFWEVVDIYCHPGSEPTLGWHLLTAMQLGKPCVAPNVEGLAQMMGHGERGLLVTPNQPKPLGRSLLSLFRDPLRARSMARRGQAWTFRQFGVGVEAKSLASLYRRAIDAAPTPLKPEVRQG